MRAWRACGAVVAAACLALPAHAAAFDLEALMALLAQRKSGEARFTEERTVSTLEHPLRASGRLSFQAPDRFARHTEQPRAESMEVQGQALVLRRGSRTRQTTLEAVPEMAALVEALRGTLTGDTRALRRHFRVDVEGSGAGWTLRLTPLDERVARSVELLEVAGQGADVRRVDLRLIGGDRSQMWVEPLDRAAR